MGFYIVQGDLLKQKYDAIVVPSQPSLRLEGNIGGKIKDVCGERLELELKQCKNINITECVITNAYNLPCKKLIHVANPKWDGGKHNEEYNLESSYISCMETAIDFGLDSIAFPLLSAGAYDFPDRKAIKIAIETITNFVEDYDLEVALVIYKESTFSSNRDIFNQYKNNLIKGELTKTTKEYLECMRMERSRFGWYRENIEQIIDDGTKSKSINEKLIYFMSLKGLTKFDCYNGVISKTAFNNIMNGSIPKKNTLVALGINMGLAIYEINELLSPLGEHLDDMIQRDLIIVNLYERGDDISAINKSLVAEGFVPLPESKD